MEPLQQSADELELDRAPYTPRRRRRRWPGVIFGMLVAAGAVAGGAYWLTTEGKPLLSAMPLLSAIRPAPRPPTTPRGYAPPRPDAGQVARAYEQLREIYAERGAGGVASFARSCAESLAADPRVLDFCVAFDIYAVSLGGDDEDMVAWRSGADARDLALARAALPPSEDAAARLAGIRELALKASIQGLDLGPSAAPPPVQAAAPSSPDAGQQPEQAAAAPSSPTAQQSVQVAAQASQPPLRAQTVRAKTPAKPSSKAASAKSTRPASARSRQAAIGSTPVRTASLRSQTESACLREAAAARRTVCASPTLREADRRLRRAYSQAITAGVDPTRLASDQLLFTGAANAAAPDRDAVETLFNQRTQELEALTEAR